MLDDPRPYCEHCDDDRDEKLRRVCPARRRRPPFRSDRRPPSSPFPAAPPTAVSLVALLPIVLLLLVAAVPPLPAASAFRPARLPIGRRRRSDGTDAILRPSISSAAAFAATVRSRVAATTAVTGPGRGCDFLCRSTSPAMATSSLTSLSMASSSHTADGDAKTTETLAGAAATKRVAVVGGGAAGLAAARAFLRANEEAAAGPPLFDVTVLEKGPCVGGVWQYDLPGAIPSEKKSRPMYRNLRTNLPRELMAFRERPWGGGRKEDGDGDGGPSYVSHRDVAAYLDGYATTFGLADVFRFGCEVTGLSVLNLNLPGEEHRVTDDFVASVDAPLPSSDLESWPKIRLEWTESERLGGAGAATTATARSETFDAVCVCSGHYALPSHPLIPGLDENFRERGGKVMHAIEYDDPADFDGLSVVCVGARASGSDLAREISGRARKVYLSDSTCAKADQSGNIIWVPRAVRVDVSGAFHFAPPPGESESEDKTDDGDGDRNVVANDVDVVVFCSGYDYDFPFLVAGGGNRTSNLDLSFPRGKRCVSPLYEQLWHAEHPSVTFVGLPHSVVPFPLFELQAQAVVGQYVRRMAVEEAAEVGGRSRATIPSIPPLAERMAAAESDAASGGPSGRAQDTHFLGSHQWEYCRRMARMGGVYDGEAENFIATNKAIYDDSGRERKGLFPGGPDTYRESRYRRDDENRSFRRSVASELVDDVSASAGSVL